MKIAELRDGDKRVDVEGVITSVNNPRTIPNGSQVADAVLEDDSGQIKFSLWNEDIEKAPKGARVHIENGYVSAYNSRPQLNVGKYGHLTFVGKMGAASSEVKQGTLTHDGPFSPAQEARIRAIAQEEIYGKAL